jgi:hypothetical protein
MSLFFYYIHKYINSKKPESKKEQIMKKLLLASTIIIMALFLAGCSSSESKEGKITSVAISFSLEDAFDGTLDNPQFGNTVTVLTKDSDQYKALWDEKLLGRPVGLELKGVVVKIKPSDDPDIWEVTEIVSAP